MHTSRHWLIGSALGCLLAATLAVLTDAAMPPAAPRPAPLPLPPVGAGHLSPFTDLTSATPATTAEPATAAPPAAVALGEPAPPADLGPGTDELQSLIDDLANRPSVDAALDRTMREMLLADVHQRLQRVRAVGSAGAEVAQLERMAERLKRLP